jgi:hypothetical protein
MKARITIVFATAVVALTVAGSALAAPHQSTVKGWSTKAPATIKPWAVKPNPMGIRTVKPNPMSIRTSRPNPTSIRGAVKAW